jgi:hypothetical protein
MPRQPEFFFSRLWAGLFIWNFFPARLALRSIAGRWEFQIQKKYPVKLAGAKLQAKTCPVKLARSWFFS